MRGSRCVQCFLVVALVFGWAGQAVGQPKVAIPEFVVDVGTIARGDSVEHSFEIRNAGDEALEIVDVKPTCGCTVVDYDRSIAPAQSGKLVATLNTKGMRGPVAKTVRVFTNDSNNPQVDLVIKADIRAYVDADPGYARFLEVVGQGGEPIRQTIFADNYGELVVTDAESPLPFIDVEFHEATEDERLSGRSGRQWVVEMRLANNAPEGAFADFVTLRVRHPQLKRLKIPVSGFIQPVVAVLPRVADFGRKDLSVPQSAVLEVKNLGKAKVTLGEVETTIAGVVPELEVIEEGRIFRLRLTLDPSMPKGDFRGTLTIPTSSRLQPVVEIDVRGSIL